MASGAAAPGKALSPASGPAPGAILRLRATTAADLRAAVRRGLPFSALEALSRHVALSPQRVTAVLGIPARTIARRKAAGALTPQESDRLYRLARVVSQACETLGSLDKARAWLAAPNRATGGEAPIDLLDTEIGARQVEEILVRVDHGIFS